MVTSSQYLLVTAGRLDDHSGMASTDTPIVAARRERLRLWIREHHDGSRKAFLDAVKARGVELNPSEVSNLQTGNKSFGENKAAEYESAAGMPRGFLVNALDPVSQPARLDTAKLASLIETVEAAVKNAERVPLKAPITARMKARLIVNLYADSGSKPPTAKTVAAELARIMKAEEVTDEPASAR